MLETKVEATDWKNKFEKLVGQVADTAALSGNFNAYEIAAEIQTASHEGRENSEVAAELGLKKEPYLAAFGVGNRVYDLSKTNIKSTDLLRINKELRSLKEFKSPHVLKLDHNSLDDSASDPISSILLLPCLDGFDLSHNDLGVGFENKLVECLKVSCSLTLATALNTY